MRGMSSFATAEYRGQVAMLWVFQKKQCIVETVEQHTDGTVIGEMIHIGLH